MYTYRKSENADQESPIALATSRKFKSKRNNSLPDMYQLQLNPHSKSKEKLKYNKWYIRPELRLKTKLVTQLQPKQNTERFIHYYESLYNNPGSYETQCLQSKSQKRIKLNLAKQLSSDLQNIRMLMNFKIKKEGRKRIPGTVDYFLKYKQCENVQSKKRGSKKKVIMC